MREDLAREVIADWVDGLVARFLAAFFFGAVLRDTGLVPRVRAFFFADAFLAACFVAISIPLSELGFSEQISQWVSPSMSATGSRTEENTATDVPSSPRKKTERLCRLAPIRLRPSPASFRRDGDP